MQVTFRCPHCDATTRASFDYGGNELVCPECAAELGRAEASAGTALERCLICPSTELYVRKDFSQKLGVTIVVIGFVLSSIAWYYRQPMLTYGILFATALIDVVLYIAVPNLLQCYRCHAQYRGLPELNGHATGSWRFDSARPHGRVPPRPTMRRPTRTRIDDSPPTDAP
jgi:hypothetical protein